MRKIKYKASVGSIADGLTYTSDKIQACVYELRKLSPNNHKKLCRNAETLSEMLQNESFRPRAYQSLTESEIESVADNLLYELIVALNEHAPPYCYFGEREGDRPDEISLGYWLDSSVFEDLPCYADLSDADSDESEFLVRNDHGNVTLYHRNRKGVPTPVWSVV